MPSKGVLTAIFRRKGQEGRYTRLFGSPGASEQQELQAQTGVRQGESPVVAIMHPGDTVLLVTTDRIIWTVSGKAQSVALDDIIRVQAEEIEWAVDKLRTKHLVVSTVGGNKYRLEIEQGLPLYGVWHILLNAATRNRRRRLSLGPQSAEARRES